MKYSLSLRHLSWKPDMIPYRGILSGATWPAASASLCTRHSSNPLPSLPFLTIRSSAWRRQSKAITPACCPRSQPPQQWPHVWLWQTLKEKTAGNSRKALAFPDKRERCCWVPPLPFSSFWWCEPELQQPSWDHEEKVRRITKRWFTLGLH